MRPRGKFYFFSNFATLIFVIVNKFTCEICFLNGPKNRYREGKIQKKNKIGTALFETPPTLEHRASS